MGKTLKRSKHWDDEDFIDYEEYRIHEKKKHNHDERQARHVREIQNDQIYDQKIVKKEVNR